MTKHEFEVAWDEAERRGSSPLWMLYSSGTVAAIFVALVGVALLALAPLRACGAAALAGAVLGFGALRFAHRRYRDWLRGAGLVCAACGHPFNQHTGTRVVGPGLCDVCAAKGPCRRTPETGTCDKCGARAFSA